VISVGTAAVLGAIDRISEQEHSHDGAPSTGHDSTFAAVLAATGSSAAQGEVSPANASDPHPEAASSEQRGAVTTEVTPGAPATVAPHPDATTDATTDVSGDTVAAASPHTRPGDPASTGTPAPVSTERGGSRDGHRRLTHARTHETALAPSAGLTPALSDPAPQVAGAPSGAVGTDGGSRGVGSTISASTPSTGHDKPLAVDATTPTTATARRGVTAAAAHATPEPSELAPGRLGEFSPSFLAHAGGPERNSPTNSPSATAPVGGSDPIVSTTVGAVSGVATIAPTHAGAHLSATSGALPGVASQLVTVLAPIRPVPAGGHTVTIALQPEGLGAVRATMTANDDQLVVRLSTASATAEAAVRAALPELHASLTSGHQEATIVLADHSGGDAPWANGPHSNGDPTDRGSGDEPTDPSGRELPAPQPPSGGPPVVTPTTSSALLDLRM
jgi:flagellar hook-length control protein FliK